MRVFLLISFLLFSISPIMAQRTTRKKLKPISIVTKAPKDSIKLSSDTIILQNDSIIFSGYDKPRQSRKETFFVTNKYSNTIKKLSVDFFYYDMDGRMLHKENHIIDCNIPSYETRRLNIPSWDKQLSFYYHKSKKAKQTGIPYKIEYSIVYAIIDK